MLVKIVNGAPGFGARMSKKQVNAFLYSGKMNLQLGTIDKKTEPNIHPVWYIYENDRFYFATETKSKKNQNIRRNKIVYFAVANEKEPFIGVRGKGEPKILEDVEQSLEIGKKIISKYLGKKKSKLAKEIMDEIMDGLEVVVEIRPRYFAAWSFES